MAEPKKVPDLVSVSLEALDAYDEEQAAFADDAERPPAPGDVYVLAATREHDVEWVVIAHDPADVSRFLLAPADGCFLAGSSDVQVEGSALGELVVRCRYGVWTDGAFLNPELRVAVLANEDVARARQKWLDVGDGKRTGSVLAGEVDDDPAYQEHLAEVVAPARRALVDAGGVREEEETEDKAEGLMPWTEELPEEVETVEVRSSRRWTGLKIAAGVAMAVAALQFWLLNERVQNLEERNRGIEQEYQAKVTGLTTERNNLRTERDALQTERDGLASALENADEASQEAAELREQIASLDRRLDAALRTTEVVNPVVTILDEPGTTTRGRVRVVVRPGASHVMFVIPLGLGSPASRYRLEIRERGGEGASVWVNKNVVASEIGEIWAGVPAGVLERGGYWLVVSAFVEEGVREVGRYELEVSVLED